MLIAGKVVEALEEQRDALQRAETTAHERRQLYREAFARLRGMAAAEITDRLGGVEWPGARPTLEIDSAGLIVPFGQRWETAQESRQWALERLRGVSTIAIDGSQIAASKEFGVPASLIQVAWFENYHDPDRPYVKDVRNQVLTHAEEVALDDYVFAESNLNQCRFALEMETAAERLRLLPKAPVPVVFVDTTLVLSFAGRLSPEIRQTYLDALFALLDASIEARIPVVGYVDLSYASDLTAMLRSVFDIKESPVLDVEVAGAHMELFDRTAALQCARGDILRHYRSESRDYADSLCFVYLKTGNTHLPARIDVPRWILDAGLLDHVIDIVRAEIVVGGGYPYALETADATAVLGLDDRRTFYRLWHDFASRAELDAGLPAKSLSKAHRR